MNTKTRLNCRVFVNQSTSNWSRCILPARGKEMTLVWLLGQAIRICPCRNHKDEFDEAWITLHLTIPGSTIPSRVIFESRYWHGERFREGQGVLINALFQEHYVSESGEKYPVYKGRILRDLPPGFARMQSLF